jgi:predicted MFS family arabinose efflux permease
MFIVLGQMQGFVLIAACTFILALLNETFRPANASAIAVYSKEENRTRSYSLNRLSINLGWAAGGALGGFIASKNYHLLFWIDGLTNIGAAILLRAVLKPAKQPAAKPKPDQPVITAKTKSPYTDKLFLAFIILTILFGCIFFQLFATQPVFFKQQLHLTPSFIGVVMAFNGILIALFEMTVVFKLEKRNKNMLYISVGTFLTGLSFIVFNILPDAQWLALFSTVIVTVGEMLSMPFMNTFWLSRTTDNNRGLYAGLYTSAWSVAQIAGPYAGAQIAQHFGFNTLWWVVGAVCTINALGFWWLGKAAEREKIAKNNLIDSITTN